MSAQQPDQALAEVQWADALLAIELAQVMALGHRGQMPCFWIKAKAGPVLDRWMDLFKQSFKEIRFRKLPVGTDADRLLGGLDIAATLSSGKRRFLPGFLSEADGCIMIMRSPDRHEPETISQICQAMDEGGVRIERDGWSKWQASSFGILICDDSEEEEPNSLAALRDRVGFHIDLGSVDLRTIENTRHSRRMPEGSVALAPPAMVEAMVGVTMSLGLMSIRPARQALSIAVSHAGYRGVETVHEEDIQAALRLSLLQRAVILPDFSECEDTQPQDEPEPPQPDEPELPDEEKKSGETDIPGEFDVETLLASLPQGLLETLMANQRERGAKKKSGQSGSRDNNFKRGRALSSVKGRPGNGKRLDLVATLRSAAPWQNQRRAASTRETAAKVHVRPDDFHVRRFRRKAETTIVFAVDASGSTAVQRLGEAKGAVELLLAEGYARRDHVALVSMRGQASEILLAPTRSLVAAKRCLSALVGGGGTPLADGIEKVFLVAMEEQRKGRSVSVVFLTDGSANIALDGKSGRKAAGDDALAVAARMAGSGISTLVIDVSRLPGQQARNLADAMAADYLPMPFASAQNISAAASQTLKRV